MITGAKALRLQRHDAVLRSTPETVIWGQIAADRQPVLHIRSGQTVRIDTVSHQGLTAARDPVEIFGALGVAADDVLQDARGIYHGVRRSETGGAHIITGPIQIEGAPPGDMLEVRVLDVDFRVGEAVNSMQMVYGMISKRLFRQDAGYWR